VASLCVSATPLYKVGIESERRILMSVPRVTHGGSFSNFMSLLSLTLTLSGVKLSVLYQGEAAE
jgi:hypothetical protein